MINTKEDPLLKSNFYQITKEEGIHRLKVRTSEVIEDLLRIYSTDSYGLEIYSTRIYSTVMTNTI